MASLHGLFRTLPVLLWAAAARPVGAIEYSRADLTGRSPFASRGHPAAAAGGPYELRGFFGGGDSLEVSIKKIDTGESRWIRVGDPDGRWRVETADAEAGTAVLAADGLRFRLNLAAPSYATAPAFDTGTVPHKRNDGRDYEQLPNGDPPALAKSREEKLGRLRAEHPEYFSDINALPEDRRREAVNAINEANRQAVASAEPAKPPG